MTENDERANEEVDITPYEGEPDKDLARDSSNSLQDDEPDAEFLMLDDEGEAVGGLELPEVTD